MEEAYAALWQGAHALQDQTPSGHAGFQVWRTGKGSFIPAVGHGLRDVLDSVSDPQGQAEAVVKTRSYVDMFLDATSGKPTTNQWERFNRIEAMTPMAR